MKKLGILALLGLLVLGWSPAFAAEPIKIGAF